MTRGCVSFPPSAVGSLVRHPAAVWSPLIPSQPCQNSILSQWAGLSNVDLSASFHFCCGYVSETHGCRCWAVSTSPAFTLLSTIQSPSTFNPVTSLFVDDASHIYLSWSAGRGYQYRTASIHSPAGDLLTSIYTPEFNLQTPQFDGQGTLFLASPTYNAIVRGDGFTAANFTQPAVNNATFHTLSLSFSAFAVYDTQLVLDDTGPATDGSLWLISEQGCTNSRKKASLALTAPVDRC